MRGVGAALMGLGVLIGVAMGVLVALGGPPRWGLDWVIWVGMIKIGLAGAIGLLAAGAILRRVAVRQELRDRAGAPD
jgi:hypothetical protein